MPTDRMAQSNERLSESSLATIYGCCGLFDLCDDADLMSLSFEGQNKFLDWLGWEPSNVCNVRKGFITYVRPAASQSARTAGYLSDPCGDPNGVDFGVCEFLLHDFGRLARAGPVRDVTMNNVRLCENQPRYRLDGSLITDQREWDIRLATEVVLQDLKEYIVSGDAGTGGLFDGLEHLVKTGYEDPEGRRCTSMDSVVIDWNHNDMDGGAGITWNGEAVAATFDIVDVLDELAQNVDQRIDWSPALAAQGGAQAADKILVMPTFMTRCLKDKFTCWQLCASSVTDTYESRQFRRSLDGGRFGFGHIVLNGKEIPLLGYDWGLFGGANHGDMYLLTGSVGNVRLIQGQYLDMRGVPTAYPAASYGYTDGGRLLTWLEQDSTCVKELVMLRPRLLMWAPWAQARIESVVCAHVHRPLSPNPWETSFFPEGSFSAAVCP